MPQWKLDPETGHMPFLSTVLSPRLEPLKTHLHTRALLKRWLFAWQGALGKMSLAASWNKGFHCRPWGRGQVCSPVVWDTQPGHFRFQIFLFPQRVLPWHFSPFFYSFTQKQGGKKRPYPPHTCAALCHLTIAGPCSQTKPAPPCLW